jgi:hypothetical protein
MQLAELLSDYRYLWAGGGLVVVVVVVAVVTKEQQQIGSVKTDDRRRSVSVLVIVCCCCFTTMLVLLTMFAVAGTCDVFGSVPRSFYCFWLQRLRTAKMFPLVALLRNF